MGFLGLLVTNFDDEDANTRRVTKQNEEDDDDVEKNLANFPMLQNHSHTFHMKALCSFKVL